MVVTDSPAAAFESVCKSPKSLRLLLPLGLKSKQMFVSLLALICGLFLLLRNPILESGKWKPDQVMSLVAPGLHDSTAAARVSLRNSLNISIDAMQKHQHKNISVEQNNRVCDFTRGKWVPDLNRPLYTGKFCRRWLADSWYCRLDDHHSLSYERYRWQPRECDLPAFDAIQFLHRMRNKTIAFIGDSLARQQFQSLLCMLVGKHTEVADVSSSFGITKGGGAQKFVVTNTTVLFYWSATLGNEEALDDGSLALHVDRVPRFLRKEIGRLDVVIVNTGHHWNRGKIKANKWILHSGGQPVQMKVHVARQKAIENCARWLDDQAAMRRSASDPDQSSALQVFVRSLSPRHFVGGDWDSGGRCDNLEEVVYEEEAMKDFKGDGVVEDAVKGRLYVKLLDITFLSKARREAHIADSFKSSSSSKQDCLHWCLPGVPDTWNELLYGYLSMGHTK